MKTEYEAHTERVRELWSEQAGTWGGRMLHWLEHPAVHDRINTMVSGVTGEDRFHYFFRKHLRRSKWIPRRVQRTLTLGCGGGDFERNLAKFNFAKVHDAIDIAEGAIEKAKVAAEREGLAHIHYRTGDLNHIILPANYYDVIWGISSIHHVAGLENLFAQVYSALKPGGYFFMDEYVGASQFQWPDRQVDAINNALDMLPPELKQSLSRPGEQKSPVSRPTIDEMNAGDPSEAIRSAEIAPVLREVFEQVDFRGCGGALLQMLLEDIAGNFSVDDPHAIGWLNRLFEIEDDLMARGEIGHDFAVLIARKPTTIDKTVKSCLRRFNELFEKPSA
jgi:2-polyprenyl-3-methyl-5-hydroxy-6-metoxy-1,4-benzoquinol methylase